MNRTLIYLAMAGVAVVLQTVLLPLVLQGYFKPDLILILVIYLGLHEEPRRGGVLVYLLGWCYDGVAGVFPGLNGFILLGVFL
ncbi:MAG: rod shape-determining protein MreD, partial [Desulfuromonadales bacterium]|nr:rod shape-determining protein MreD [Desulfuromonadales bacterium]